MVFYILNSIRNTNFLSDNIHFSRAFWPENTPRASIRARDSIGMNMVGTWKAHNKLSKNTFTKNQA